MEVLEKKIDNLTSSTQRENSKLKEQLGNQDESLREHLSNQKVEFETKLKIAKENVADDRQQISEEIERMKTEIHTALETGLSSLSTEKLSRDSMAQMLLDVAIKIQGADITTLLTEEPKSDK